MDLAEYRKAVHERLMRTGLFMCVRQEDFGAQNAGAVEFCRQKAQEADMFVGLIGLRRGWEPEGDNEKRSITEMEHNWARDAGRPRYMWVAPDDFPVPGNMRESDDQHARQTAFRKRVMGGGERIVSQKGFGSPDLLAAEIVEQLLVKVVTTDLQKLIQPEPAPQGQPPPSKEEHAPAIAAAVERLAEDKDVDLLALAKNPEGLDVAELEAKLKARAEEHEAKAQHDAKTSAEYWRHVGALAFLHDTNEALAASRKAVELDRDNPDGWRYLGYLHHRLGDLSAARQAFTQLKELGEQSGDPKAQSGALLGISWIEYRVGRLISAGNIAGEALRLAETAEWSEGIAHSHNILGIVCKTRGDLTDAEQMLLKALKLNAELGSKTGLAASYSNLGSVYQKQGDHARAEQMYQEALKLNEELGRKEGMANAYLGLAIVNDARANLPLAEEMCQRALKLNEELGYKGGIAAAQIGFANILRTRGDLVAPEDMQLKALKLFEEFGGKEGVAGVRLWLGCEFSARGDLMRAEDMQLSALKLYEGLGGKEGMAYAYGNLGSIYQARGDKAKMCDCWRKRRDLWREMGMEDKAAEAEKWLRLNGCGEE